MHPVQHQLQQGYNKIAKLFSQTRKFQWKEFSLFKPYLSKGITVLDMGCGNGRLIPFIDPYLGHYTGIDFSTGLLTCAQKLHPEKTFVQSDMAIYTHDSCVDAIFSIAAFHHLPTVKQRVTCLQHWSDQIKPNRVICLTTWNLYQKKYLKHYLESYLCGWFRGRSPRGTMIPWKNKDGQQLADRYYYSFIRSDFDALAELVGLKVELCEYVRSGEITKQRWNAHNLVIVLRK